MIKYWNMEYGDNEIMERRDIEILKMGHWTMEIWGYWNMENGKRATV